MEVLKVSVVEEQGFRLVECNCAPRLVIEDVDSPPRQRINAGAI